MTSTMATSDAMRAKSAMPTSPVGASSTDEALALEHQAKGAANVVVVFHDQDTGHPNSFGITAQTT